MNVDKKVIAAISSAVGMYLQAEQESLAALQSAQAAGPPRAAYSPFMLAGRQAAMETRWAWQMRIPR